MLEQRAQQHFIDSADLGYQSAQALGQPVAASIQALWVCVTSGGKVLCGAEAGAAALACYAADQLSGHFERERPGLSALSLDIGGSRLAALSASVGAEQVQAQQVRALGQPGDVLLLLSVDGQSAALLHAVQAAHERDMSVVALTGAGGGDLGRHLRETDVHVSVPHDRVARVRELQLLVLHALCDGVDAQLLGEQESS
jgi:D-sedoheptulose 7-phosphate isomerase